jgi:beta-RFAP synthase
VSGQQGEGRFVQAGPIRDDRLIRVRAPARLHLGFLDLHGGLCRCFGGIGLALDAPATELELSPAAELSVSGPEAERARRLWLRAAEHLGVPAGGAIRIRNAIPAHAGFGSGTQLGLALAAGAARLHRRNLPRETALALERGARSGIGIASFFEGGLIVDGGKGPGGALPPVIGRMAFPEAWRVLLVLDPLAEGIHGAAERAAFAALGPFPESDADRICRTVLMQILPAAAEADLAAFGAGIADIQRRLGNHFAPAQGGHYTSPRVAAAMAELARLGVAGLGQSSWGPTAFALFGSEAEARDLLRRLDRGGSLPDGLQLIVARGRNTGAEIGEVSPASVRPAALPV